LMSSFTVHMAVDFFCKNVTCIILEMAIWKLYLE
jgi:hypothetical protein